MKYFATRMRTENMEFPELVLALIRDFSRPRVNKEALQEYLTVVRNIGDSPCLKRKMVTPEAVEVVREFNRVSILIRTLETENQTILIGLIKEQQVFWSDIVDTPRMTEINRLLEDLYDERIEVTRNMCVLVRGEAEVRELEKTYVDYVDYMLVINNNILGLTT